MIDFALPVELDGLTARTVCADGTNLAVFPLSDGIRAVPTAELQPGWISPRYGVRRLRPAAAGSAPPAWR